ncbi:hypothetical protein [Leptospira stimsonii]|uniref:Uncharacterized protein n=1 Tax=Leptospira stimsonii TaxID=2202203 RepID=A0A396Z7Z7_9LEPT|nr:hypothetical protein [Leptospira stimsonii]RHX89864.1 hypothetical protein DLM75_12985 [Leptospira stimsonii]
MSTEPAIRERAFFLYAISGSGSSKNSVAKQIRSEYGTKTTAKTIDEWSKEKDKDGLTWEDKRNRIVARAEKQVEVIAENRLVEIQNRTKTIADLLYKKITEETPKLTSLDNAIYAYKAISELELTLPQKYGTQLNPSEIISVVLKLFKRCEPVGRAISDHWEKNLALEIHEAIEAFKLSKINQVT